LGIALGQHELARAPVQKFHTNGNEELARQVQAVEYLYEAGQVGLLRVYTARSQSLQVRMDRFQALDTLAHVGSDLFEASGVGPELLALLLH
jgi:hypothetical protein